MTTSTYVIPCGAEKLDHAAPARQLYSSSHWQWQLAQVEAYAERMGGTVLVLSAQHGLVDLDQELLPYDTTLDDSESCITPSELADQLEARGLDCVMTFLPRAYLQLLKEAAQLTPLRATVINQFMGCRGIGDQRKVLRGLNTPTPAASLDDTTDLELRKLAADYRAAEQALADARQALADSCADANYRKGFSEYQLAKLTGFRRGTIRTWLGK